MQTTTKKTKPATNGPAFLEAYQAAVEAALNAWLPSSETMPRSLHEAMHYAVFSGGKRMRPALVYATGLALDVEYSVLDAPAVAVEMMHTYSLIHDDLPAMDDDELRRGQAACHKKYGEGTAILAGNSLQALAFHVLASEPNAKISSQKCLQMIATLAHAVGSRGMAAGQVIDLSSAGKKLSLAQLQEMHTYKTGMLIEASVTLGTLSKPEIDTDVLHRLINYGKCIGLAFQIQDDILDIEGNTETLGKPHGSDLANNKLTYPGLLSLDSAKDIARQYHQEAISNLSVFDKNADTLRQIADYIITRDN